MQKMTLAALSLAFAGSVFAAPAQPSTTAKLAAKTVAKKTTPAKTAANTAAAAAKPATSAAATTKTADAAAKKTVLLSKIIVPDGVTPARNVKTTPVPDISPVANGQYVVINIPQQRLFFYNNGALEKVYPVAVGKAITQTNLGEHKIGGKAFDPTWHIPKSIQAELKDGRTAVPPGSENPLGPVFVRLGNPKLGLGIHGTNAPGSVPGVRSHGCVRMKSEQAMDFANTINTGANAIVSYEMATLNVDSKNQLWLTAYKDPYNKNNLNVTALKKSIQAWAQENKVKISDARVSQIIQARRATPICISCAPKAKASVSGSLMSIAWNGGTAALTVPQGMQSALPPVMPQEDLTEIEVEADVPATPAAPAKKSVAPTKTKTPTKAKTPATEQTLQPKTPTDAASTPAVTSTKAKPAAAATPAKTTAKPVAKQPAKTNNKVNVQGTSVFDSDNTGGAEPEGTPLYPTQPVDLKPIDSGKTQSKTKAAATAVKTAAKKTADTAVNS